MSRVTIAFLLPGWQLTQIFNTNLYQNTDYRKKLLLRLKHREVETSVENLSYHDTEHKDLWCFKIRCCVGQYRGVPGGMCQTSGEYSLS